jgi:hypothetical protein
VDAQRTETQSTDSLRMMRSGGVSELIRFDCGYGANLRGKIPWESCRRSKEVVARRKRLAKFYKDARKALASVEGPRRAKDRLRKFVDQQERRDAMD